MKAISDASRGFDLIFEKRLMKKKRQLKAFWLLVRKNSEKARFVTCFPLKIQLLTNELTSPFGTIVQ